MRLREQPAWVQLIFWLEAAAVAAYYVLKG